MEEYVRHELCREAGRVKGHIVEVEKVVRYALPNCVVQRAKFYWLASDILAVHLGEQSIYIHLGEKS